MISFIRFLCAIPLVSGALVFLGAADTLSFESPARAALYAFCALALSVVVAVVSPPSPTEKILSAKRRDGE